MARYVYRHDDAGRIRAVPASGRVARCSERDEGESFEKHILRSYYDLECKLGSRFRPDWGYKTPAQIKEAWSNG